MKKVVAFLPAKGTSERVPNKNLRHFNGEPFFVFSLRKLLACPQVDEVLVDSEDEEVLAIADRLGATRLPRHPSLATNATDGHELFRSEVARAVAAGHDAEVFVQVLCTSPFLRPETIGRLVDELLASDHDSAVLVRSEKVYEWRDGRPAYGYRIPNSSSLEPRISEAMSLYAVKRSAALHGGRRIGNDPLLVECRNPAELVDVNTPEDFSFAETVASGILARERRRHRMLSVFLSSALLSDVCDAMGLDAVAGGSFRSNLPDRRVLGRARTLALRPRRTGESAVGIYDALQSYQLVAQDDVIVVRGHHDCAYFGELNAALAVRSGAQAAIVEGMTRDVAATRAAGFPVWSRGSTCRDVRGRAVVESINEAVVVGQVRVEPSSLVFADEDGVVVIPKEAEEEVLLSALRSLDGEKRVLLDVLAEVGTDEIVRRHGFF